MENGIHKSFYPSNQFDGISIRNPYAVNHHHVSPPLLLGLLKEKEVLENGLANCVTYLHVLRKKQAHNYRRLNRIPLPPRKKRKRYQQIDYELDRQIKQREQDEEAFLNNLQACKANIYIVGALMYTPKDVSSLVPDCSSTPTQCSYTESEPTESSWNGWADEATSPLPKQSELPFFADEIAPDARADDLTDMVVVTQDVKRPPLLSRVTEESTMFIPAPPNTACSQFSASILNPSAAVFEPRLALDKLSLSPSSTERRCSNAGLPGQVQKDASCGCRQTLYNRQQQSPDESMIRGSVGRERSRSV